MYIDAKGKESLELKGMPVRARRGRQCKVSERRGRRGGGAAQHIKISRMECEISVG